MPGTPSNSPERALASSARPRPDDIKREDEAPPIKQFRLQIQAAIDKFDVNEDKDLIATTRQIEQNLITDIYTLQEMRATYDKLSGDRKEEQEGIINNHIKDMQKKVYTFQSTARSQANGARPVVFAIIGAVVTAALTLIGCAIGFFLTGTPMGAIAGQMLGSLVTKALTASALVAGGIFGYTRGRQNETVDNLTDNALGFIDTPRAQFG